MDPLNTKFLVVFACVWSVGLVSSSDSPIWWVSVLGSFFMAMLAAAHLLRTMVSELLAERKLHDGNGRPKP